MRENNLNVDNKFSLKFKIVVAITVVVRSIMQLLLPLWARGNFTVDDYLMADYANELSQFNWLGEYGSSTLNKVPGYSVFLAVSNLLGIPYMLSVGIFYSIACVIFLIAIKKIIKKDGWSLVCFLFLLFSPIMFDDRIAQQIYRLVLIPPLVIIVISSYLIIYVDRKKGIKKLFPWMFLGSAAFSYFYLVREDSVWFCCFIFGATVLLAGLFILENRKKVKKKEYVKYFSFLMIPVLCCVIGVNVLCAINYNKYGLYVKTDFNDTYYAKVCSLFMSIEPKEEIPKVYVSRDTVNRAFEISPTLCEVREELEKRYNKDTVPGNIGGEFERGFFSWNLRWAVAKAGLYDDAVEVNEFYKKVYDELQKGFEDGTFKKRDAIILSSLARPIREGDMGNIIKYSFKGFKDIISYTEIDAAYHDASGVGPNLKVMTDVTNQILPGAEGTLLSTSQYKTMVRFFNIIIKIYQFTWWILAAVAMVIYLGEFVINIVNYKKKRETNFSIWMIKTGLLLTIWGNLLVISVNYFEACPDNYREYYAAGVYPIWQIFLCLSLSSLISYIKQKKCEN